MLYVLYCNNMDDYKKTSLQPCACVNKCSYWPYNQHKTLGLTATKTKEMLSQREKFANLCCHFHHHSRNLWRIYNPTSSVNNHWEGMRDLIFQKAQSRFWRLRLHETRHSHQEAVPPPVGTDLLQCSKQPMQIYTAPVAHAHTEVQARAQSSIHLIMHRAACMHHIYRQKILQLQQLTQEDWIKYYKHILTSFKCTIFLTNGWSLLPAPTRLNWVHLKM